MKTLIYSAVFLSSILLMVSNCKKDKSNECSTCDGTKKLVQYFSNVNGVVKKVQDGEPYYDARKYYVEVDAQTYLSKLYMQNQIKIVRLFPCSRSVVFSDSDTNRAITISGNLSLCSTANHGSPTNNILTFNIYEP